MCAECHSINVPIGAQSYRFIAHYLAERDADPGRMEAWIAVWDHTQDEDADAVERQQKGLCSGRVSRLRYVPAREKPAPFIIGLIREACRDALGEAPPVARAAIGQLHPISNSCPAETPCARR